MPHPFSPSSSPVKKKRQLRHVESYYVKKGDKAEAAKFAAKESGGPSKEAISRRLKKKGKK